MTTVWRYDAMCAETTNHRVWVKYLKISCHSSAHVSITSNYKLPIFCLFASFWKIMWFFSPKKKKKKSNLALWAPNLKSLLVVLWLLKLETGHVYSSIPIKPTHPCPSPTQMSLLPKSTRKQWLCSEPGLFGGWWKPQHEMPDPLELRAEASQNPGKWKELLVQCTKAKNPTAGRDPEHYLALYPFFR